MDKFRSRHGKRATTLVGDDAQNSMYDKASSTLASEINDPIFEDRSAFYITQLRDRHREILQGIGADNAIAYRTDRPCKRLTNRFGSDVQIVPQRGMSSLVCSSTITVAKMCVLATKLQKEVADSELLPEADDSENDGDSYINTNNDSFGVTKHLRSQMRKTARMLATKSDNDGDNHTQKGDNALILSQPVLNPSTSSASQDSELEISYESAFGRIRKDIYNHIAWIITKFDAELGDKMER